MIKRITSLTEIGIRDVPGPNGYESISEYRFLDKPQDLRGQKLLMDHTKTDVTVCDMLVDPDRERVAMINLSDGRRVAIESVRIKGAYIQISPDADCVIP